MSVAPISAWSVATGVWWIQTREPRLARKLGRRSDTRLVAFGVVGGFLRIFEVRRSPSFVRRLTARYTASNERFREPEGTDQCLKQRSTVMTASCHS
jgi:hypothetical protein